jgi:hypothetical protein
MFIKKIVFIYKLAKLIGHWRYDFSAYDGGTFGLSNRYASAFLWLNKLGLAAEHNYKVFMNIFTIDIFSGTLLNGPESLPCFVLLVL